ncbi:MAG: PD-(D/E)XK nuclease family protein, partial [Candidatus Nealsonbacteria bacterium]|nr:PD-(D/E)XK nuclease family protein [Candidatus Nealsonbacteria bacterium]
LTRGKLFFVGDYKQSIYRFRGAEPHVFERLCEKIPAAGRLPLSLNFRSQPAVLDFVNALFCEDLGPQYESLLASRKQVSPRPSVEMIWATPSEPGPKENVDDLRRREADWIARRIRAMLDRGEEIVWDEAAAKAGEPAARAVRPGDVALLFRALSNVDLYEEALRRYDIDYYLVGGRAFYAQQEIFDLVNLLRTLDSPGDEVSLAGVLRSPFFSLLDETLYWLAQHPDGLTGGLFADALPEQLDAPQREQVAFAAATLRELRAIKDRLPIARLIDEALARTGYDAVLLAEFLGERKLANLRKLVEGARSFDRSGIFTLSDFITQLSEFVARQPDESLAATCPESSDVVRLMTIHQAKGLEFPVTVIPDLDRSSRGSPAQVAFTPRLGPMVKAPDAIGGLELYKLTEEEEERAESARLLYVATTRAADYLILSAGLSKLGTFGSPWMGLIERRFGRDVLDVAQPDGSSDPGDTGTIVTVGDVPIRVTVAAPPLDSKPSARLRRRSLQKIVEKAREMADAGSGRVAELLAPVPPDRCARRQYSFSRLNGTLHAHPIDTPPSSDDLSEPRSPDPLGLGTLVHAVLAEVEFGQPVDVPALVSRHGQRHLPAATGQLDEATEMIARFLQSPRARAMADAAQLHAELEFLLPWPSGKSESGGRYLQGFIDCLYRDADDRWHIVDYKTNRTTPSTLSSTAADYEMQMLLYALAVERILGHPPASLTLCFLRSGQEHTFPWNTAARGRVVEMLDEAMRDVT